jgi:hypothetical protein
MAIAQIRLYVLMRKGIEESHSVVVLSFSIAYVLYMLFSVNNFVMKHVNVACPAVIMP